MEAQQLIRKVEHFQQLAEHRGRSIDNLLNTQGRMSTLNDQLLAALELLLDIRCPITGNPSHADLVEHWEYEKEEGDGEADANLQALAAIAAAKGGAA